MRVAIAILLIFMVLPLGAAINLEIKEVRGNADVIVGLTNSVEYEIYVKNNGADDYFSFYTFFQDGIKDLDEVLIKKGEEKNIIIKIPLRDDVELSSGNLAFKYFIQASDKSEVEETLGVRVYRLGDVFSIGATSADPDLPKIDVFLKNNLNRKFENINVKISSPFFMLEKTLDIGAYEKKNFEVDINGDDWKKLTAGFYTIKADFKYLNITGEGEGKIEFIEKENVEESVDDYGLFVKTRVIRKMNNGNVVYDSSISVEKGFVAKMFTTFSRQPDTKEKVGGKTRYTWNDKIVPGEYMEIKIKTNWLIPILIFLLIFASIYFFKKYTKEKVSLRKQVSFVRARGGEFALKITIIVEAKELIENVRIIDKLPPLVKMYERFGGELPDKISKDKKRLEWNFNYLDAGDRRIMTYVVYSKVGVLGRFALPNAICRFKKEDGKAGYSTSNKAYFLSESSRKKII